MQYCINLKVPSATLLLLLLLAGPERALAASAGTKAQCKQWACTCQGFSDLYRTRTHQWVNAPKEPENIRHWWVSRRCETSPRDDEQTAAGGSRQGGSGGGGGGDGPGARGGDSPEQANVTTTLANDTIISFRSQAAERSCAPWYCTCQGFSQLYDTQPGRWGTSPPTLREWWLTEGCNTRPRNAAELQSLLKAAAAKVNRIEGQMQNTVAALKAMEKTITGEAQRGVLERRELAALARRDDADAWLSHLRRERGLLPLCNATSLPALLRMVVPSTHAVLDEQQLSALDDKMSVHRAISWGELGPNGRDTILRAPEADAIGETAPGETGPLRSWLGNIKWSVKSMNHELLTSQLGNQAGCLSSTFIGRPIRFPHHVQHDIRPVAGLIKALHGRTLCFAGDSVDLQIYWATLHAAHRLLDNGTSACEGPVKAVVSKSVRLDEGCTRARRILPGWRSLKDVDETTVTGEGGSVLARFRFFKF